MSRVKKGGSIASQQLAAQMPGKCDVATPQNLPPIPGMVSNFYMTTGGSRKKRTKKRKSKSKRAQKRKSMQKRKRQKGGSVLSDTVMQSVLGKCNGVTEIPNFPPQSGGGSDWMSTHNSMSSQPMSPEQFGKFTQSQTLLPAGQMQKCILNGPMWK
jgi:hypothetical protein